MRALVLAGGEGTRLRPFTHRLPKPLLPLLNRPFLEHLLRWLRWNRISQALLALGYQAREIERCFGEGGSLGLRLHYSVEDSPLGTGGAIKQAQAWLEKTFLLINGDILTDLDLAPALRFHRERKAEATLILREAEETSSYGLVQIDERGRVLSFREKPSPGEAGAGLINSGIYLFSPKLLDRLPAGRACSLEQQVFSELLASGARFFGFAPRAPWYWLDVGTVDRLLQAHFDALEGRITLAVSEEKVSAGVWAGKDTAGLSGATLVPPLLVGERCWVGRGAVLGPRVCLGPGVTIGERARVKESVLWERTMVGAESELSNCLVGAGEKILPGLQISSQAIG
jgi:NDP-sugar pyrophosphorylase family protein